MRLRSFVLTLVAFASVAVSAQAAPFPGWERRTGQDNVLGLLSPADGNQRAVAFFLRASEPISGTPESWFADNVAWFAGKATTMIGRSGMRRAQNMMLETGHYRRVDGVEIDILVAAYPVRQGRYQLMAIIYPAAIQDSDPRVVYAIDFLASAYRSTYEMRDKAQFDRTAPNAQQTTQVSNEAPPAPTPPVAAPPPKQSGQNCYNKPIWGLRVSPWCQPSGVCNDLWIKDYERVCE